MNKIKLLLIGVASMGASSFAFAANETAQTPPCAQPDNQECQMPCGAQGMEDGMQPPPPPQGCFMAGQGMQGPGMGGNPQGRMGMDRPNHMMRQDGQMRMGQHFDKLPKEIRERLDTLHSDRQSLRDLWETAVLSRGDKTIEALRTEFAKTNAQLISKIEKSDKSIREDIDAIRSGFDSGKDNAGACMPKGENGGEMAPFGMQPCLGEPPFGSDKGLVAKIDADVVAEILALKEPLTAENFAIIREKAIAKNKKELDKSFDVNPRGRGFGMQDGMPMMMPPMNPDLARMREEMGNMRGEKWRAKGEFRAQLREAMKIKDQVAREAAVKKILDDVADGSGDKDHNNEKEPATK